ncbi:MAG: ferrous iron transport protein B [Ruminococcaceae bacterium]|nr:ferrous iron transport protein B [Oscillospiraceae bacterium]
MNESNILTVGFVGNPNVGKSTLFNELTGLKQHTGNWTGKTVESAEGTVIYKKRKYLITDLPGTYSLMSNSPDEEVTRDFVLSDKADVFCVVCDSACLERNLPLVLQISEHAPNVVLVLNLWDEAKKYHVTIDVTKLSGLLDMRVVKTVAKKKQGTAGLLSALDEKREGRILVRYGEIIEYAIDLLPDDLTRFEKINIICSDKINSYPHAKEYLFTAGYYPEKCSEEVSCTLVRKSREIAGACVKQGEERIERNRRIDKIVTGRFTAVPIMCALLCLVLYITLIGANYPSQWLSVFFSFIEERLNSLLIAIYTPDMLRELIVYGIFRVLSWVVAVMLPPMAIFFPLFTLLEECGFLPRIAFNTEGCFSCSGSCGKQALTMCMGFGCNAVGVCGCRIINSQRERLVAILTNVFVPCNGRFPTLVTLITVFFVCSGSAVSSSAILCLCIIGGIVITLIVSALLSKTLLRGVPSSFTLELPPYRMPNLGDILVRSFLDRTLFVLGRAITVAAPAGAVIWILANIKAGEVNLLTHISGFLDPFGMMLGLDGVILLAFILGFPANEIVLPIILMGYVKTGVLSETAGAVQLRDILSANGWDKVTCICMIIFTICHFPCSTTLLTVKKETGSLKWTFAAFIIPTLVGMLLCFTVNLIDKTFL